jgi:hypothetical protein
LSVLVSTEKLLRDVARGRDLGPGYQLELGVDVEALGLRVIDDDRPELIGVDLAGEDVEPGLFEGMGHA